MEETDLKTFKVQGMTAHGDSGELEFRVGTDKRRLLIRVNEVEYDVEKLEATLEYAKKIWLS